MPLALLVTGLVLELLDDDLGTAEVLKDLSRNLYLGQVRSCRRDLVTVYQEQCGQLKGAAGSTGDAVQGNEVSNGNLLLAAACADMLGRVGIKVNLVTADYQAYLAKYWLGPQGQADAPLALNIGVHAPTGDDTRPNYDSRYQPRNNGSGYSFPEVDKLFDEGKIEPDLEKQKAIYGKLAKILSDEVVAIWIGTCTAPNIATPRVQNIQSIGFWDVAQRWNEVWLDRFLLAGNPDWEGKGSRRA